MCKLAIPGAPAPIGPYSQAVVQNSTVYVSGQIPLDPVSGELVIATIEEATHQVLKNIRSLLEEAGGGMENVVKCSIFMTDLDDFGAVNTVYASYFPGVPPARETVQVVRLPMNVPIEISCIATI
jgi:2-iminobutanoate/2-iminopropanoate deaminase